MCGIFVYLKRDKNTISIDELYDYFMKSQHRGKNISITMQQKNFFIGFHRLSINGLSHKGNQPFIDEKDNLTYYCVCNGEIYNYKELAYQNDIKLETGSDCEIIIPMYQKKGINFISELKGEFSLAILIHDNITSKNKCIFARDTTGKRGLYIGHTTNFDEIVIGSELKNIPVSFPTAYQIEPRIIYEISETGMVKWMYKDFDIIPQTINDISIAKEKIKTSFIESVKRRMMSEQPIGALLSGGLDSSLVVGILSKLMKERGETLNTFCIGMEGSPDAIYAQKVADYCGTNHTQVTLTKQQFLEAIPIVINKIETYDITTIRASIGQYLISKYVEENTNIKVLFVGDGSDEILGGYKYFHCAPSSEEFDKEAKRLTKEMYKYDNQRGDRAISACNIEGRYPFQDEDFMDVIFSIKAALRQPKDGCEKWILRESFRDENLIPHCVLNRQKEAFSDGVSSQKDSLYNMIQEYIPEAYKQYETNDEFPISTNESNYYRKVFYEQFGNRFNVISYYWMPKWIKSIDPSARTLSIYKNEE